MSESDLSESTIIMNNKTGDNLVKAVITDIQWERIIMHITVKFEKNDAFSGEIYPDFYLVTAFNKSNGKFKSEKISDDTYIISMNVTNPGYCMCIPTGTYSVMVCRNNDILTQCEVDGNICPLLNDKSRTFLHNGKTKGYNVNFAVSETEESLAAVITVADMTRSGIPVFNEETRPEMKPSFYKKFNKKLNVIRHAVISFLYSFSFFLHKKLFKNNSKKTILFMSEQNDEIGSNLTSIIDRMKVRGMEKDYIILTSARATIANPHEGIPSWLKLIRKLGRADMIFLDDHSPAFDWLIIKESVPVIQLWHAGAGFKSSGYSRWGHTGCPAPVSCHRQYKYGIAGSKNIAHFFSEVFGINTEQILPTGMPRMDEFMDPDYKALKTEELYKLYPIAKDRKVILFAPTYRGKNRAEAYYPYELIDFDRLYDYCKRTNHVVFFKMHPWVPTKVPIKKEYRDRFVDANLYPNINDLFYITNLLITDYSSNIFEYSLMRQPALFFAFDEIQYAFSRGFHRDYESSAPGTVCHTFDEVMNALESEDFKFEKIEQYVTHHFDHFDSKASDRVIDWIILDKLPEDIRSAIKAENEITRKLRLMDFSSIERPSESDNEQEEQTV